MRSLRANVGSTWSGRVVSRSIRRLPNSFFGLPFIVSLLIGALAYGEAPIWKPFSNRAGWRINYPADWKIGSCRSCPDPTAPDVFVDFIPPTESDSGWVMVEVLEDKPSNTSDDTWFTEIKRTVNQNPEVSEKRFTLNSLPALRVRYRNPTDGGHEMEEVYVISGSRTFQISFDGNQPGLSIDKFRNYHTFLQMVETFRVKSQ